MSIDRKQILDDFLDMIWTISDKAYQKRIWIMGLGPECDSYDEVTNDFFSTGDAIIEEYSEFGITPDQLKTLMRFRNVFSTFPRKYDLPQEFIDSLEWESVIKVAKEVLKAFNYTRHT